MANLNPVLRYLGALGRSLGAERGSDRELLDRFTAGQDAAAFETLLRRHGPMVLRTCQRVLRRPQDAEDAFQATFVVLARKAGAIRGEHTLAGWLHRVALHIALRARAGVARHPTQELQVDSMAPCTAPSDVGRHELRGVLDEELDRLPAKYRAPLVLHYLEGKTKEETARHLGWTEGTVSGRLARARDMLRVRLGRRGLALSAGAVAAALTEEAAVAGIVAPPLLTTTLRGALLGAAGNAGAATVLSPHVLSLVDGALQAFTASVRRRFVLGAVAVLLLVAGGIGAATLAFRSPATAPAAGWRQPVTRITGPTGPIQHATFAPDGQSLALASQDRSIYLCDAAGKYVKLHTAADGVTPYRLEYAPDGQRLAVGFSDGTVRLFDVAGRREVAVLQGHRSSVTALAFAADGRLLASAGGPGSSDQSELIVWDVQTHARRRQLPATGALVETVAFSPDGSQLLAMDWRHRLKRWDIASGQERPVPMPADFKALSLTPDDWRCLALAPSGNTVALTRPDRFVFLYNLATGQSRQVLQVPSNSTSSILLGPDTTRLLWIDWNDDEVVARVVNTQTKEIEARQGFAYEGDRKKGTQFRLAPGGRMFASYGDARPEAQLWLITGKK